MARLHLARCRNNLPRHVTDFRSDVAGNCRNDKALSLIQQFDGLMSMGVVRMILHQDWRSTVVSYAHPSAARPYPIRSFPDALRLPRARRPCQQGGAILISAGHPSKWTLAFAASGSLLRSQVFACGNAVAHPDCCGGTHPFHSFLRQRPPAVRLIIIGSAGVSAPCGAFPVAQNRLCATCPGGKPSLHSTIIGVPLMHTNTIPSLSASCCGRTPMQQPP